MRLPAEGTIPTPGYDRSRVVPGVVHFGVGGFHRAHQAMYHDRLLSAGTGFEYGICGVGVMPQDRAMKLRSRPRSISTRSWSSTPTAPTSCA